MNQTVQDTHPAPPRLRPLQDFALFLDVDGTLLRFADHPDAVDVPSTLPSLLKALCARMGGALALISGRPMAQLDQLFGLDIAMAGLHGAERRRANGQDDSPDPVAIDEHVVDQLQQFTAMHTGLMLEHKAHSLALHYRRAPDLKGACAQQIEQAADFLKGRWDILRGNMVYELRPSGIDKGRAVQAFMQEAPFEGRQPVFVGDDVTDEDGFSAVNALGGLSILVGDRSPSAARYALPGVTEVHDWLAGLSGDTMR